MIRKVKNYWKGLPSGENRTSSPSGEARGSMVGAQVP